MNSPASRSWMRIDGVRLGEEGLGKWEGWKSTAVHHADPNRLFEHPASHEPAFTAEAQRHGAEGPPLSTSVPQCLCGKTLRGTWSVCTSESNWGPPMDLCLSSVGRSLCRAPHFSCRLPSQDLAAGPQKRSTPRMPARSARPPKSRGSGRRWKIAPYLEPGCQSHCASESRNTVCASLA